MANGGGENFFDVLIDRLIVDVKKDFERNINRNTERVGENEESTQGSPSNAASAVTTIDDLVGRMIDLRARMEMPAPSRAMASYGSSANAPASRRFDVADVMMATSGATRAKMNPKFTSSSSEFAYQLVAKSGALFYIEDLVDGSISREALKRERRRVLLSLHPDRHPEADRARAHEAFLQAADAFSVLAEGPLASTAGSSAGAA